MLTGDVIELVDERDCGEVKKNECAGIHGVLLGGPNALVQGRPLGMAEARAGGGVPCNAQLGRCK